MIWPTIDDLNKLIREHGVRQIDLSKESGLSRGEISKVLNGRIKPRYAAMQALFEAVDRLTTVKGRTAVDIMSRRVIGVSGDDTIEKARKVMLENDFSQLPVRYKGMFAGIITEGGLLKHPDAKKVSEAMEYDYAFVPESMPVKDITPLILRLSAVFVVKNLDIGVVGIITKADLLK